MDELISAISTVGFPIVCTVMLMYLLVKENENHKNEMNSLKDTIAGNTLVLAELKQIMSDMLHPKNIPEDDDAARH
jgi:hypothetical protein